MGLPATPAANACPVDGVRLMPKKVDNGPSRAPQIGSRARICDVDIVEIINERLGHVAAQRGSAGLRAPASWHDGKIETRVKFRLMHESLNRQIV